VVSEAYWVTLSIQLISPIYPSILSSQSNLHYG